MAINQTIATDVSKSLKTGPADANDDEGDDDIEDALKKEKRFHGLLDDLDGNMDRLTGVRERRREFNVNQKARKVDEKWIEDFFE